MWHPRPPGRMRGGEAGQTHERTQPPPTHGPQHTHGHTATALDTFRNATARTTSHTHPPKTPISRAPRKVSAVTALTWDSSARTSTPRQPGSHTKLRSRREEGCPQEPPGVPRPPAPTGGRRPASQARPVPDAPPPRPAAWVQPAARSPHGGLASQPSPQPAPAPATPRHAPPRAGPSGLTPAPREPGAVSDPPPANAAPDSRNSKQPDTQVGGRQAPIPRCQASGPARPGGSRRRQDSLFRGPRAPRAHPGTHTQHDLHRPLRRPPAKGTHSSRGPGRGPHSQHSWFHPASFFTLHRSGHAPTHAFPALAVLGPAAPAETHRRPRHVHPAHTIARAPPRSGPVPTPSHTYTDLTSTHRTHTSSMLPAGRILKHSSPHAEQKHKPFSDTQQTTLQARAHTNAQKCRFIND